MGAASVTGIGQGEAFPSSGRSQFVSLLDPHIVWFGSCQLDGSGQATINMPSNIQFQAARLAVFAAGKQAGCVQKNVDGDGIMISFDLAGSNDMKLDFIVIDGVSELFQASL